MLKRVPHTVPEEIRRLKLLFDTRKFCGLIIKCVRRAAFASATGPLPLTFIAAVIAKWSLNGSSMSCVGTVGQHRCVAVLIAFQRTAQRLRLGPGAQK